MSGKKILAIATLAALLLNAGVDAKRVKKKKNTRRDIVTTILKDAGGAERGKAAIYQIGQQIRLEVIYTGAITGATHGVHLHQVGKCEGPDFASAGPHWNPYKVVHGMKTPGGGHAGDLPNLVIDATGTGKIDALIDGIAITEAPMENLGAVVVHEKADDMMTDPSGNSGKRIACGAFGK